MSDAHEQAETRRWQRWSIAELPPLPTPEPDRIPVDAPFARVDADALRERIRAQAEKEGYQAGFTQGRNEGYRAGLAEGRAAGKQQGLDEGRREAATELDKRITQTLAPLAPLARNFDAALARLDSDFAAQLVELALAVGCHLARHTLDMKPQLVTGIVRDLLHVEPALVGKPRLWLHPEDLVLVQQQLGDELAAANWSLHPDDQVSRGGCRVTGNNGEIDATWEQRLESIRTNIRKPRSRARRNPPSTDRTETQ